MKLLKINETVGLPSEIGNLGSSSSLLRYTNLHISDKCVKNIFVVLGQHPFYTQILYMNVGRCGNYEGYGVG